ncbi:MAG TPA: hypothetical protein VMN57_06160 [Anaerolineales bacterium]|nr:hypothetical protein [Anaerolineales bacterium]
MSAQHDLDLHLARWIRRRRRQRGAAWAGAGIVAGAAAALILAVYAVSSRDVLIEEFQAAASAALLLGGLAGFLAGLLWPVSPVRAAREFDLDFNLKERVSTALDLRNKPEPSVLAERQIDDALAHAARVDLGAAIPLRFPIRQALIALALAGLTAAVWHGGRESFEAALARRQTRDIILAEAERIEALIEEIRADEDLTEEQQEALAEPLEEALAALEEAETLEEAYSALEEAEEQLKALEDPEAEALAEALQNAGEALAEDPSDPLQPFSENLAEGDFEAAADDLREVDAGAMEQAERERLAEQLETLADALEDIDPALADALREAAQAAREGDTEAAQEALEQAAQALEELAENVQVAEAAGDATGEVEEGQARIVQAGQEPGEGVAAVPGEGGGGTGDGGQGTGENGDGAGEGGDSQGGEAGDDPIGQGNDPDGSGESAFQPITPSSIGGEGSDWVAVPPSGVDGDNVTGTGPSDPGDTAPITVPYTDVLPQYQAAANAAIDSGIIPPQYRDIVRDYFSSLEP